MTREETIKWLESLKAEIGKSEHRTLWHYAEAIDMAIEALEYIEKNKDILDLVNIFAWLGFDTNKIIWSTQKWIPCSEKLPEYNDAVLTWDGYAYCIEKRIPCVRDDDGEPIEGDWWVGDEFNDYESECYTNLRDGAAIAWMPIPEPYKAESEDKK